MYDDHKDHNNRTEHTSMGSQDVEFGVASDTHPDNHDLEAHSDDLRRFDEVREQSVDLRTKGKAALIKLIDKVHKPGAEPATEYEKVKALRVALQTKATSMDIEETCFKGTFGYVADLKTLSETKRTVLIAAESMRALVATNEYTLCPEVMRCWYWIVRELFTVTEPDWAVGGARAAQGGSASGFVTAQCVHAVLDLSDSLAATHDLCNQLGAAVVTLDLIKKEGVPAEWQATDRTRIASSLRNTVTRLLPRLAFEAEGIDFVTGKTVEEYLTVQLPEQLKKSLRTAVKGLSDLNDEIGEFRKDEETASKSDDPDDPDKEDKKLNGRRYAESTSGHGIASAAVIKAQSLVNDAIEALERKGNHWGTVAEIFQEASIRSREGLQAARKFLSRTIDEQLAASGLSDGRQWEPAELAFAANAFVALTGSEAVWDEERIMLAASRVQRSITPNGTFVIRIPYYQDSEGQYFAPSNAVLAAAADLLRATRMPLTEPLARRLLPGLIERRVIRDHNLVGWRVEYSGSTAKEDVLATASAVEALVSVNRLLDDGINGIILPHFSVRLPDKSRPGLDDLFYPDYGFAKNSKSPEARSLVRPSCALVFQRLRAQVTRTERDPLHSLVLYGPAGTGKTTLVEALAQTCDVPMVEVTPSDLAKGGETALERRARAVFEALSLLTHVVILFDEFDPILRRRDATGRKEFNYFSFLTPGMLPKLKNLSEKANKRSVAYVLITNLLGTLDEAAVRRGRFDERLGVFSPDPLSRLGRMAFVAHTRARAEALKLGIAAALKPGGDDVFRAGWGDVFKADTKKPAGDDASKAGEANAKTAREIDTKKAKRAHDCMLRLGLVPDTHVLNPRFPPDFQTRLRAVAYRTCGLGMPQMTSKGWYRADGTFKADTPLGYILDLKTTEKTATEDDLEEDEVEKNMTVDDKEKDTKFLGRAEPEDPYNEHLRGTGEAAQKEAQQWWWLHEWDKAVALLPANDQNRNVLDARPDEIGETVGDVHIGKSDAMKLKAEARRTRFGAGRRYNVSGSARGLSIHRKGRR